MIWILTQWALQLEESTNPEMVVPVGQKQIALESRDYQDFGRKYASHFIPSHWFKESKHTLSWTWIRVPEIIGQKSITSYTKMLSLASIWFLWLLIQPRQISVMRLDMLNRGRWTLSFFSGRFKTGGSSDADFFSGKWEALSKRDFFAWLKIALVRKGNWQVGREFVT